MINKKQPNILCLSIYCREDKYVESVGKIKEKMRIEMQQVFI